MKTRITHEILRETIHLNILPSGFKCYIMPKKGFLEKQAVIAVNYGSADTRFIRNGKIIETPEGVAHFLEHKLFEDEDVNLFDEFSKLGADINAFTNYNTTAYHFNCIDNFSENLRLLLKLVTMPYFTDENIEKEKGIIAQEISMYQDYPTWRVFFNLQGMLYSKIPVYKDIAGTKESISRIDKNMLYECYESFYRPENMALICTGDIEPEEVFAMLETMAFTSRGLKAEKAYEPEPERINLDFSSMPMPVSKPLFNIGFKDRGDDFAQPLKLTETKILIDYICGESSHLYEELYQMGLIDQSFSGEYVSGPMYGTSIIGGYSKSPETVRDRLFGAIETLVENGIDEGRLQQLRKKHEGKLISSFNSIEAIANLQADLFNKGMDVFGLMDSFADITAASMAKRLSAHLKPECCALSVIAPEAAD